MKHFPESEFIINADGSVFHLHLQFLSRATRPLS